MVDDAEKYKSEDDAQRKKIDARNSLEQYAYSMKNTMRDDKVYTLSQLFPTLIRYIDSWQVCSIPHSMDMGDRQCQSGNGLSSNHCLSPKTWLASQAWQLTDDALWKLADDPTLLKYSSSGFTPLPCLYTHRCIMSHVFMCIETIPFS